VATGSNSDFISTRASAGYLLARPKVAIVLAAMRPWLYATTVEAAAAFQALLQALSAFGALFVFRNVFGASKLIGLLVATASPNSIEPVRQRLRLFGPLDCDLVVRDHVSGRLMYQVNNNKGA